MVYAYVPRRTANCSHRSAFHSPSLKQADCSCRIAISIGPSHRLHSSLRFMPMNIGNCTSHHRRIQPPSGHREGRGRACDDAGRGGSVCKSSVVTSSDLSPKSRSSISKLARECEIGWVINNAPEGESKRKTRRSPLPQKRMNPTKPISSAVLSRLGGLNPFQLFKCHGTSLNLG